MAVKSDDEFEEQEAQRRFEALVRAALKTPPKPMKGMPRKRPAVKAQTERAKKAPR